MIIPGVYVYAIAAAVALVVVASIFIGLFIARAINKRG